jgi:hypothetical protein
MDFKDNVQHEKYQMEMVLEANLLLIVTDKFLQLKDGKKP